MKNRFIVILLSLNTLACQQNQLSSRHYDTDYLERPPMLARQPSAEISEKEVLPAKHTFGLGDDVYLSETEPVTLRLKQPLEKAWRNVGLALQKLDAKITDYERDKARYYVNCQNKNLFSFLENITKQDATCVLTLTSQAGETVVSISQQENSHNSVNENKDGYQYDNAVADTEGFLTNLYHALRDDLNHIAH